MPRLRVDVLGPLRVLDMAGSDLTPDGVLQRRLLALLVLRRGHVVSVDSAIDALWPADPPRDPVAALQNHLFRLRRGLPDGLIESAGNGYRLPPAAVDVDADRLAQVVTAVDEPAAPGAITELLERWQGPAYPELEDVDEARVESARLNELRVRAREALAEAKLATGATTGLVAELSDLVHEYPLRERPRALLMSALASEGRSAEALRVYDDFRRLLGDELGIEPSPSLTAQHATLLRGGGVESWSPPPRLPTPTTSLVGRHALVDAVAAAVDAHRLVSLVGPGGVGKTRMLVEVGRRLRASRPDLPIVMCELAVAAGDAAIDVVATALAIDPRPGVSLTERIAELLVDTDVALLLDNCEHVIEPVADLVERVLAGCPRVTVITTSRERLRLPGERLFVVPPLPIVADAAVQLFVERARAVAPDFDPDIGEMTLITEITRRLDGLPLAIELAAARLHTLDVGEVAAGLDDRFAMLSTGYRTSSRHGSLSAAVSWSFELLDARLQQLFTDVSVFAGPFAASDAAAVCDVDLQTATAALQQLAERSLLMRTSDRRYVMLETLRAFGAERLVGAGRELDVGRRHALHQLDWVERAQQRMGDPDSAAIVEIDAATTELRAAVDWMLDHDDVVGAGRIVAALMYYGFLRLRPDVLAWSERVLRADPDDRSPLAPVMWAVLSYATWMRGDIATSTDQLRRAQRLAEGAGDLPPIVAVICGNNGLIEGRLDDAVAWYRRAIASAASDRSQRSFAASTELLALAYGGDPRAVDAAAALLADVGDERTPHAAYAWYCAGESDLTIDVERARRRFVRALELAEATHASFVTGSAGASKASLEARHGDPEAAAAEYRRLIAHWHRAGMWPTQWTMLRSIAGLLARLGRYRDSAVLLGAVLATESGHRIFGEDAVALTELGSVLRTELGDAAYESALNDGAALDGSGAVAHALHTL